MDEGALAITDTAGVKLSRAEIDGAAVAVTVLVVLVFFGFAIFTSGGIGIAAAPSL